jgi:hypothetical protein
MRNGRTIIPYLQPLQFEMPLRELTSWFWCGAGYELQHPQSKLSSLFGPLLCAEKRKKIGADIDTDNFRHRGVDGLQVVGTIDVGR